MCFSDLCDPPCASIQVLATVLAEFRPKREGEGNYSALVTNFVRSVQARIKRQAHGKARERSERSERRPASSSLSSEDSYGRTRKRKASSSESVKESVKEGGEMQALHAAVQSAQEGHRKGNRGLNTCGHRLNLHLKLKN